MWFEVVLTNVYLDCQSREEARLSGKKWYPYNKGGDYRKWYGNSDYLVNWEKDGHEIRTFFGNNGRLASRPQNMDYYFKESATWSKVSSGPIAFRYKPTGNIFDVAGTSIFAPGHKSLMYILGLSNSKVVMAILQAISPTINYEVGQIANIPVIQENEKRVEEITEKNIMVSKADWDSFETSWDFKKHPLI